MPPSLSTVRRNGKHRKTSWVRRPAALAERVEQAHALDPVVGRLSDGVVRALPAGPRTDALHGVPFGPTDWENSSLGAGMPASVVVTGRSSVMVVLLLFAACGPSIWLTLPGEPGLPRPAR